MIRNTLDEIGGIVLLRSDAILRLLAFGEGKKVPKSAKGSLRDFYPSTFRIESLDAIARQNGYDGLEKGLDFHFLGGLYERFFANASFGERIACDKALLQEYSGVINKIHPYTIIGYKLEEWLFEKRIGPVEITRYADFIMPLGLPLPEDEGKEYAELHMHAGGANENILNLWEILTKPTPKAYYDSDFMDALPRLTEFSFLNSGSLRLGQVVDIAKIAMCIFRAEIFKNGNAEELKRWQEIMRQSVGDSSQSEFYSHLYAIHEVTEGRRFFPVVDNATAWLWQEALERVEKKEYYGFWLLWHIMLFSLLRSECETVRNAVAIFFHAVHILRSYQLMSQNVGLGHFSEFFGSGIRQVTRRRHENIAKNIFQTGTTMAEVKISPGIVIKESELRRYCRAFNDAQGKSSPEKRYHFSVHFVRKEDKREENKRGLVPVRHQKLRRELYKEARKLQQRLFESGETMRMKEDRLSFNLSGAVRYDPAQMVASIDAAGKESRTPPEVFAPIFNYLRYEPKRYAWPKEMVMHEGKPRPRKRLKISVHAGEDFSHIATGMRRIDESIEYYGMREGDRLGHALAVGLSPVQWLERNGPVYLSKEELLDTLVWLRHWAYKVTSHMTQAVKLIKKYEEGIQELVGELYGIRDYIDPNDMFEAWRLRKYCPIVSLGSSYQLEYVNSYYEVATVPKRKKERLQTKAGKNKQQELSNAFDLYRRYHIERNEAWRKIERLDYRRDVGFEDDWKTITNADLELFEAIQDAILQKIADRGIVIETNPSSNIYIAMLYGYEEHPIFRWSPVENFSEKEQKKHNRFGIRKGKVEVCINTDDPAIFPTTLYTEYLQIRHAAEKLGYHKPAIERWLDGIRQKGVEIFRQSHEDFKIT